MIGSLSVARPDDSRIQMMSSRLAMPVGDGVHLDTSMLHIKA